MTLETIREINVGRFKVKVTAEVENFADLSFDETGEIERQIQDGTMQVFCAKATCYLDGRELAVDYLGGCIYKTPADFQDHKGIRKQGANVGSYFSAMVRTVCREARQSLQSMQEVKVRKTA